jgi:hypothetical protein
MAPYALDVPGFHGYSMKWNRRCCTRITKQRSLLQKARRGWVVENVALRRRPAARLRLHGVGAERGRIEMVLPGYRPVAVVPNGVDVARHTGAFGVPEVDTLIYSGALTYEANFDAMDFFLREVFPLIRAERPNARIAITGKLNGVQVDRLPRLEGVVFTGYLTTSARRWRGAG